MGEGALYDFVAVRRRGYEVVKMRLRVVGKVGAVGKAGKGPARSGSHVEVISLVGAVGKAGKGSARSGGHVEVDVMKGLGGGRCAKGVLSSC